MRATSAWSPPKVRVDGSHADFTNELLTANPLVRL
jgi:hypothetical protein